MPTGTGRRYRAAEEQAYTVPDLAAAWRCNADELRRAVTAGEFEGAFKIGRAWRIPKEDARAWRERRSPFRKWKGRASKGAGS